MAKYQLIISRLETLMTCIGHSQEQRHKMRLQKAFNRLKGPKADPATANIVLNHFEIQM